MKADKKCREVNLKDGRDGQEHLFEARNGVLSAIQDMRCAECQGALD